MDNESVLITGGAGYLGNVLSRDLLDRGHKVTCLDNLMYSQGQSIFPLVSNPNYNFVYGDVRDDRILKTLLKKSDVIIPLAAIVGAPACDLNPESTAINFEAIRSLDRLRSPNQKVVCPISNSGYGTKTGADLCTEETPMDPISLYGRTKVDAEKVLLDSDKDAVTLRLATVFGISPRMRRDLLINDFVYQALTAGCIKLYESNFRRNFLHISDASRAFMHSMDHFEYMKNEPYNVGIDSGNMSKLELAEKVKKKIPNFSVYTSEEGTDPDKRNYIVLNEKIRRAGFEANITVEEGIDELIKGYNILLRNNPHTNL
ncbi:MAG: NAD(P)-dependent oxidoreductase [Nanoarchaeota archaeon]|nr:NAD(P)-dependent oxidoreductase [Nanoarchaeota archaeon]